MPGTRLAEYELKELTMRGGGVAAFERGDAPPDERDLADRVGGLGVHATSSLSKKVKPTLSTSMPLDLNQLSGDADPEELNTQLKHIDQHKKLLLLEYLRDKLAREKAEKKEKKKERKEAKKAKKAKKAAKRKRSSSSS